MKRKALNWWIIFPARRRNPPYIYIYIPPFLLENIIPITVPFSQLSFNSRSGVIRSLEMRSRSVPKVVPFLVLFWITFGFQNGPQNGAKSYSNLVNFGFIFGSLFVEGLEFFGCSWEPSWASWGSLGRPLDPKNIEKPMVF